MKRSIGILLTFLGLGLISCNNDVDLTGDYEDTPVVYCLLNPGDSVHYIRIQKAFLVNGDVLQTAQIPDSLKYDPTDLNVKLIELNQNTGAPIDSFTFVYQPNMVQDTGIFAQEGIMIYKSTADLTDLRHYKLKITNTALNKEINSETGLVYGFTFKNPNAGSVIFNPISGAGYSLRWGAAQNGFVYQPEIIFHWDEVNLTTLESIPDSLVWRLSPKEASATELTIGTEMEYNLSQNAFYRFVGENLEPKAGVKRVIGTLTFKFYVGTEELNTYVNVNKPSIGLIQEKPVYTNITNGLGIFAGRSTFTKLNVPLANPSKDTLIFSTFTENLSFTKN